MNCLANLEQYERERRIELLQQKMSELRAVYHHLRMEVQAIDRKKKRVKQREKERAERAADSKVEHECDTEQTLAHIGHKVTKLGADVDNQAVDSHALIHALMDVADTVQEELPGREKELPGRGEKELSGRGEKGDRGRTARGDRGKGKGNGDRVLKSDTTSASVEKTTCERAVIGDRGRAEKMPDSVMADKWPDNEGAEKGPGSERAEKGPDSERAEKGQDSEMADKGPESERAEKMESEIEKRDSEMEEMGDAEGHDRGTSAVEGNEDNEGKEQGSSEKSGRPMSFRIDNTSIDATDMSVDTPNASAHLSDTAHSGSLSNSTGSIECHS